MKQRLLYLFVIMVLFFSTLPKQTNAALTNRYATCDQCGLCADITDDTPGSMVYTIKGSFPSQSWPSCVKCLYDLTADPATFNDFETLKMVPDPENNANMLPNPPKKGRFFTGLGCFSTDLSEGFRSEGAASALTRPLLNVLLSLAGGIAFLYLLYGSFLIVTSHGDPEQLNRGKRTLIGSIVGVVFAMSAVFLINLIANGILRIPGFG